MRPAAMLRAAGASDERKLGTRMDLTGLPEDEDGDAGAEGAHAPQ